MRGIYLFKLTSKNLKQTLKIKDLDFVWVASKNSKYLKKLKDSGLKLFYPIGITCAKTNHEKKFTAVDKTGNKVSTFAGWYTGVCPNNPIIRRRRLKEIKSIINSEASRYHDGIYLDAIRYPTYWEDKKVVYLDTCYCKICKDLYSKQKLNWTKFRINQIENIIKDIKKIVGRKKLGYFAVPETHSNLEKIFAQLPEINNKYFDFVSPMIYPQMVGKDLNWVGNTIKFFEKYYKNNQIIPIIQTSKMPDSSQDIFDYNEAKKLAKYVSRKGGFGYFALDLINTNGEESKSEIVNSYLK